MRFFTGFITFIASATILFLLSSTNVKAEDDISRYSPVRDFPEVAYSDMDGNERKLDTRNNKLTALHFWATWCKPCIEELPQIDKIQKKYAGRGLKIVPLSMDNEVEAVQKFYSRKNIKNLEILMDSQNRYFWFYRNFNLPGVPATIFINSQGKAIAVTDGAPDWNSEEIANFLEYELR